MSMSMSKSETEEWIKIDLHIHTLDDPKDAVDYSAHQLLERARALGFRVLAITLHDAVFDRPEVFADAAAMGILLIPAAEMRLHGADVIVLNVTAGEMAELKSFDDLRRLRAQRGDSIFTIGLHAFGRHYTSVPMPSALTAENVFAALRSGPLRLTSPACSFTDLVSAIYFVFLAHPFRVRRKIAASRGQSSSSETRVAP